MTGPTNSDSSLTRPVTSQFSFNESDGTITLSNGKKFAVEIGDDNGFKTVGRDSQQLIKLVTNMLDQIGEQEGVQYKDLSQTMITNEGVTTDQKDKQLKTYKLATHEKEYEQITQTAQLALSGLPKPPVASNRLSVHSSERGRDVSDLSKSSKEVERKNDSDSSLDVLEVELEKLPRNSQETADSVNEAAAVRFTPQKKPGKLGRVKQKILQWFSGPTPPTID